MLHFAFPTGLGIAPDGDVLVSIGDSNATFLGRVDLEDGIESVIGSNFSSSEWCDYALGEECQVDQPDIAMDVNERILLVGSAPAGGGSGLFIDTDGDGFTEPTAFGSPPFSAGRFNEIQVVRADCSDFMDNDGDFLSDFSTDPGCSGPEDDTEYAEDVAEILDFFDDAVASGSLVGAGPGRSGRHRLKALRSMLGLSGHLIDAGASHSACGLLWAALKRTDGDSRPRDFVEGEAAGALALLIHDVRAVLGCRYACGLGFELVFLLRPLMWLRRRRSS